MFNTALVLETAALFLVAFLIGATAGLFLRRLTTPAVSSVPAERIVAVTQPTTPLVVAPTIAPISGRAPVSVAPADDGESKSSPVAEGAIAATEAGGLKRELENSTPEAQTSVIEAVADESVVDGGGPVAKRQPTRTAGEATAAAATDGGTQGQATAAIGAENVASEPAAAPETPAVVADADFGPVRAQDVPPIDELAHVVDPAAAATSEREIASARSVEAPAAEISRSDTPSPRAEASNNDEPAPIIEDTPPEPVSVAGGAVDQPDPPAEDAEAAAMRAIEGGWTPRHAPAQPAPTPELSPAEVAAAIESARSAVASAASAARTALADASTSDVSGSDGLHFETVGKGQPEDILASDTEADASVEDELTFEQTVPHIGFGRPPALVKPRGGGPDNLKQINGLTPQIERSLNGLGIFHLDQIAAWDHKATVWLDQHLSLHGRIGKDRWIEQARSLTDGRRTAPAARPVRR